MSCCSPQHCSNSNSTRRERKASQVVPKSQRCWASDPRRPNTPKMRHLQPCQLLLPMYLQQCLLLLFCLHQRGNKTLTKTNPTRPHLPSHAGFLRTRTESVKKSIQHSANKRADKTHVGIWSCETTSCFQLNKFNASFPRGIHVGNWPTGVTADCKDPGEKGQLFSASAEWEFSVVPSNLTKPPVKQAQPAPGMDALSKRGPWHDDQFCLHLLFYRIIKTNDFLFSPDKATNIMWINGKLTTWNIFCLLGNYFFLIR